MANRIIGLKSIHLAPLTEANGVESYETPIKVAGAKSLTTTNNFTEAQFYSDDIMDYYSNMLSSVDVEMELAYLMPEIEAKITGKTFVNGGLVSSVTDKSNRFALLYEMETLEKPIRRVIYDVTLNKDESAAQTKTDSVEEQLINLVGKAKSNAAGLIDMVLDKNSAAVQEADWDKFFTQVLLPEDLTAPSAPAQVKNK